jgi:deoxyribonuclease-4
VSKERDVPFGIEVMGRVRELGSADDVVEISRRLGWVRPVLDFAHMHATSDGAFLTVEPFAEALAKVDAVLEPGAPFHIHFSDIQYANRNETKHLPYGDGTLRAEPLAEALAQFERPATVISESPDEESSQAIRAILSA